MSKLKKAVNDIVQKELSFDEAIHSYSANNKHQRYVSISKSVDYGINKLRLLNLQEKNILIVEDRLGGDVTEYLASQLIRQKCNVVVISKGNITYSTKTVINKNDTNDSIKKAFSEAKDSLGSINGVINLCCLSLDCDFFDVGYDEWKKELEKVYLTAFHSVKIAYDDFNSFDETAFFVAVTNIGGTFGTDLTGSNNSSGGIITGVTKALKKEIERLHCKVIDFTAYEDVKTVSSRIIEEIQMVDDITEIAYDGDSRKTIIVVPEELEKEGIEAQNVLTSKDTLLFVGGGRGILGAFVKGIVSVYNSRIVVIGRSKMPSGTEEWIDMDDDEIERYKTPFIKSMKEKNPERSVIEIIYEFEKIKNSKLLYENFKELKKVSNNIHYYSCDISNEQEVKSLKTKIVNDIGNITGIVNGAGLPSFGSISKKNPLDSFNSILVKGLGFYNLITQFSDHPIKFINNVGSISGRFGMDGQVDYVAACDLVVKMTARVVKSEKIFNCFNTDWTAWEEIGMAALPFVEKIQRARGLDYIGVKEGTQRFLEEIAYGSHDTEVLIFNSIGAENKKNFQLSFLTNDLSKIKSPIDQEGNIIKRYDYPYINRVIDYKENYLLVEKKLNIKEDIHLRDHIVKGNYVFAAVSHIETFVEMAFLMGELLGEEWHVHETESIKLQDFVKYFESNPLKLKCEMLVKKQNTDESILEFNMRSDFQNKNGLVLIKDRLHSIGKIVLNKTKPQFSMKTRNVNQLLEDSVELDLEKYYEKNKSTIHFGELFRSLNNVKKISPKRYIGEVIAVDDSKLFSYLSKANTRVHPITMDCIGRVALVGLYDQSGISAIPVELSNIVIYRLIKKNEKIFGYTEVKDINNDEVRIYQEIIDENNIVICSLSLKLHIITREEDHKLEMVCVSN